MTVTYQKRQSLKQGRQWAQLRTPASRNTLLINVGMTYTVQDPQLNLNLNEVFSISMFHETFWI